MAKERGMRRMGTALIGFAAMAIQAMQKANRFTDQLGGEINPGRIYGPRVTATKNIGRNWLKTANSVYRPHQGKRECARRVRTGQAPSWTDPTGAPPFLGTATQPGPMFNRAVKRREDRAQHKAEKLAKKRVQRGERRPTSGWRSRKVA